MATTGKEGNETQAHSARALRSHHMCARLSQFMRALPAPRSRSQSMWPRQESNLDLELRKLLYYPLYYEAGRDAKVGVTYQIRLYCCQISLLLSQVILLRRIF